MLNQPFIYAAIFQQAELLSASNLSKVGPASDNIERESGHYVNYTLRNIKSLSIKGQVSLCCVVFKASGSKFNIIVLQF